MSTGSVEALQVYALHIELTAWAESRPGQTGKPSTLKELLAALALQWELDPVRANGIIESYLKVKLDRLAKVLDAVAYFPSLDRVRREGARLEQGTREWLVHKVESWVRDWVDSRAGSAFSR